MINRPEDRITMLLRKVERIEAELAGEKAAALNYRADAIEAEKQLDDANARAAEMERRYDRLTLDLKRVVDQRDELLAALGSVIDCRRMEFLARNKYELKYLPIYADQPDPTYIVKWVWEVRDQHGASVAEAHEWLYQAIDKAEVAAIASVKGGA